jgi:hypothetical protein
MLRCRMVERKVACNGTCFTPPGLAGSDPVRGRTPKWYGVRIA